MKIPMPDMIPVSQPHFWGNEGRYVKAAIEQGWISSMGEYIPAFEQKFAQAVGVKHAVAVTNGTAALHVSLDILGVGSGDEVIVPDFCMISPVLAVLYCGATPVPVDVDETWNLDPALVEDAITPRTRVIIVVHTYGHPANIDPIIEIARRHGLRVVEDIAESVGATNSGRQVGTFGDVACVSFYANKIITTGEGGMLVTNDAELFERARAKRNLCFGSDDESRFVHEQIGYNYRLTNLQAAIGLAQTEHFDEAVSAKREIGRRYNQAFADLEGLTLPPAAAWATNVYWVYGVVVGAAFGVERREVQRLLREAGIETRRFFTPVRRQPILQSHEQRDCPQSDYLSQNGFYLPSYIGMSPDLIMRVADTLKSIGDLDCARR